MKKKGIYFMITWGLVLLNGCAEKKGGYNPEGCLTTEQQNKLLYTMVRYASKLPPEATQETKYNPQFNWYYDKAITECKILYCFMTKPDSTYLLLVSRKARSITPMEVGIALKVRFSKNEEIDLYHEIFRTWKMPADTLRKRGRFLFELMTKGKDLTLYYSKFQKDKFIEFPDDRFTFDVEARRWRDQELDSLMIN